ncbi:hypothetical protein NXV13_30140 [Bacteroides ovatus]|nr:hypothetical protein [Bacteroides ovatus]
MVPGGDKALDGNSMTGGFGTPTQRWLNHMNMQMVVASRLECMAYC